MCEVGQWKKIKLGEEAGPDRKGLEYHFRGVWTMSRSDGEPLKGSENLITQFDVFRRNIPLAGLEWVDMVGREDEPEWTPAGGVGGRREVWCGQAPG